MAWTSARVGYAHRHGAAVSCRGGAEPRRHAGGSSPGQRGVFLPLGLVPVHVQGELTVLTVASFQSRVAAFAVMVRLLSPPILFYFLFQVGQVFLYFQW